MRDDVITLETPYTDRSGAVHDTIRPVCRLNPYTALSLLTTFQAHERPVRRDTHFGNEPRLNHLGP
jgi:hypothetical protein